MTMPLRTSTRIDRAAYPPPFRPRTTLRAPAPVAPAAYAITRIDGTRLNVADEGEAVRRIITHAVSRRGGTVFTLNLDHLVKLEEDPAFRAAYERATYVTADGAPVVAMARRKGVRIDRVTGADLVLPLAEAAAMTRVPVFLFGSSETSLQRAADRLCREAPGLRIAGMMAPAQGFDPFGPEARRAVTAIEASGAGICLVALGAPKQELFANAAVCRSSGVMFVCVGAALDFLAGSQIRAPRLMRDLGLEWVWRLCGDPRRMSRRYLRSAAYFGRYLTLRCIDRMRGSLAAAGAPE